MVYHPFRHLGLKFLAIAIATLLWLTVAGEPVVERSLSVPLVVQNPPAGLELIDNPPDRVSVRVRGLSGVLGQLEPGSVLAALNLQDASPGQHYFQIGPGQVQAPSGVEILQVFPTTIALQFEPSGTKTVPVKAMIDGEPAPGYLMGSVTVSPPTIEVVGPVSALNRIKEATTDRISISGATTGIEETVNIGVAEQPVRLASPQAAKVTIEIGPTPAQKTVPNVPVHLRGVSLLTAQSVPPVVSVEVKGPARALEVLQPDSIVAFVELAGLGSGRYNLPVRVEPSQNLEVIRIEPARVSIRIK